MPQASVLKRGQVQNLSCPNDFLRKVLHLASFFFGTRKWPISHVLNEQRTGYECLKSIGMKSESYHMKEHPRLIQIVKFDRDWRKVKSMVGLSHLSLQSILSSLSILSLHTN